MKYEVFVSLSYNLSYMNKVEMSKFVFGIMKDFDTMLQVIYEYNIYIRTLVKYIFKIIYLPAFPTWCVLCAHKNLSLCNLHRSDIET